MSEYKYADVSLSDTKKTGARTLILDDRWASTSQTPPSKGSVSYIFRVNVSPLLLSYGSSHISQEFSAP